MNDIGRRIAEIRKRRGLTQEQLGEAIGESKQTIFKYERGIITNIPLTKIERIADVLGCPPAVLAGWDNAAPVDQAKDIKHELINTLVDMLTPDAQRMVIAQLKGLVQSQTDPDDRQGS